MIGFLIVILSYLIGSLSSGIILSRVFKGKDIRKKDFPGGAGGIRQYGFTFGASVGLLDILKGLFISFIAVNYGGSEEIVILSLVAVVAGHNWPIYFNFNGGQGLATTIGVFIYMFPVETVISFLVGGIFFLIFKIFNLSRFIKFFGGVPFSAIFALTTLFILVYKRYSFYPYTILVICVIAVLIIRGLQISIFSKRSVR